MALRLKRAIPSAIHCDQKVVYWSAQAENQICSEFSDDRCSFYSSKTSLGSFFVCAFFKRKHIFRISDIFEAEDSTKKEIIMCYAPHLSGKKVTRDLSRGQQRRKKGNLHIFEHCWINFFPPHPSLSSLLCLILILYIFLLVSSESKNSLKSRRMMNTRPLKHRILGS